MLGQYCTSAVESLRNNDSKRRVDAERLRRRDPNSSLLTKTKCPESSDFTSPRERVSSSAISTTAIPAHRDSRGPTITRHRPVRLIQRIAVVRISAGANLCSASGASLQKPIGSAKPDAQILRCLLVRLAECVSCSKVVQSSGRHTGVRIPLQ